MKDRQLLERQLRKVIDTNTCKYIQFCEFLAVDDCKEGFFGPQCRTKNPINKLPQNFPIKPTSGKTTSAPPTLAPETLRPFVIFAKPGSRKQPGPGAVVDTRVPTEDKISINQLTGRPVLSKPTVKPGRPDPTQQSFQPEPFELLKVATPIYFQETNTEPIFNAETTTEVLHTAG